MKDPFYTYGPPDLCAWQVEKLGGGQGIFWLQTTDRSFGRKLRKRLDTRRVAMKEAPQETIDQDAKELCK
jgi:hypothetical protein